jgi:hypothetical protein
MKHLTSTDRDLVYAVQAADAAAHGLPIASRKVGRGPWGPVSYATQIHDVRAHPGRPEWAYPADDPEALRARILDRIPEHVPEHALERILAAHELDASWAEEP